MFDFLDRLLKREAVVDKAESRRQRLDLGDRNPDFTIYAIGDVHGRLDLLLEAECKIAEDMKQDDAKAMLVLLGDYIDRGPDSAAVLDHLTRPPPARLGRVTLCGNHEAAFLDFIAAPLENLSWLDFGGRQTLLSYGIDADYLLSDRKRNEAAFSRTLEATVPLAHRELIAAMPVCLRIGSFVFVHAGLRPGLPLQAQTDHDMLWIREPFLSTGPQLPYVVIHGHTPAAEPQTGPGRICIDTGAFSTGRLTVLKISNNKARILV